MKRCKNQIFGPAANETMQCLKKKIEKASDCTIGLTFKQSRSGNSKNENKENQPIEDQWVLQNSFFSGFDSSRAISRNFQSLIKCDVPAKCSVDWVNTRSFLVW